MFTCALPSQAIYIEDLILPLETHLLDRYRESAGDSAATATTSQPGMGEIVSDSGETVSDSGEIVSEDEGEIVSEDAGETVSDSGEIVSDSGEIVSDSDPDDKSDGQNLYVTVADTDLDRLSTGNAIFEMEAFSDVTQNQSSLRGRKIPILKAAIVDAGYWDKDMVILTDLWEKLFPGDTKVDSHHRYECREEVMEEALHQELLPYQLEYSSGERGKMNR